MHPAAIKAKVPHPAGASPMPEVGVTHSASVTAEASGLSLSLHGGGPVPEDSLSFSWEEAKTTLFSPSILTPFHRALLPTCICCHHMPRG